MPEQKVAALTLKRLKLSDIEVRDDNPRLKLAPGMPAYEDLKRSIEENGYADGMVWNERTGHLVGGHQRLTVLRDMGYEEVDVQVVDLPEEKEARLNIILNRVSGDWDYNVLAKRLAEMPTIEGLGFEAWELRAILADGDVSTAEKLASWKGMPEFIQDDLRGFRHLIVHFKDQEAVDSFAELVGQELSDKTRFIWWPDEKPMRVVGVITYKNTENVDTDTSG